jgi:hypothetical protein
MAAAGELVSYGATSRQVPEVSENPSSAAASEDATPTELIQGRLSSFECGSKIVRDLPGRAPKSTSSKKRLFVCCDGTWNDAFSTNKALTNVSRIARCIKEVADDGTMQIVYVNPLGEIFTWSSIAAEEGGLPGPL